MLVDYTSTAPLFVLWNVIIMAKMGRPKIEIDQAIFESLCKIQCTEEEMCGVFRCCEDTLNSWCKRTYKDDKTGKPLTFSDTFKKYSQDGKVSLRRAQFRMAMNNPSMAIWLGKQYLGQKDEQRVDANVAGGVIINNNIPREEPNGDG